MSYEDLRIIPNLSNDALARFYDKIKIDSTTGCWNWTGGHFSEGYGGFSIKHKMYYSNRVAWKIYYGEDPHPFLVLHECDNRSCVKKEHLFLGDQSLNMLDCVNKGRHPMGRNPKLAKSDIKELFDLQSKGMKVKDISSLMGLSLSHTYHILEGRERVSETLSVI